MTDSISSILYQPYAQYLTFRPVGRGSSPQRLLCLRPKQSERFECDEAVKTSGRHFVEQATKLLGGSRPEQRH